MFKKKTTEATSTSSTSSPSEPVKSALVSLVKPDVLTSTVQHASFKGPVGPQAHTHLKSNERYVMTHGVLGIRVWDTKENVAWNVPMDNVAWWSEVKAV